MRSRVVVAAIDRLTYDPRDHPSKVPPGRFSREPAEPGDLFRSVLSSGDIRSFSGSGLGVGSEDVTQAFDGRGRLVRASLLDAFFWSSRWV